MSNDEGMSHDEIPHDSHAAGGREVAEMFKKILLPVDLTDRHDQALEIAAELATQSGAGVTLLHVIETLAGASLEEERDFYGRLERAARAHLHRLGRQLDERKVSWQAEILYGNRAPETARHAAKTDADLIILTAPRFDPANPVGGWGSMSYKIGLLSPCPVLLVK
jgi:nucleotide-binding universal stress UspA family protein